MYFWGSHLLGDFSNLPAVSSNIVSVNTCSARFCIVENGSFHVFVICFAIWNSRIRSLSSEFITFLMGIVCNVSYKTYTAPVTFV